MAFHKTNPQITAGRALTFLPIFLRRILLSVCGNKEAVVQELISWAGEGEDDMAFKYNIIRAFEDEKAEGKAEDIVDLLEELGTVSGELRDSIFAQKDLDVLRQWHKRAAHSESLEDFETHMWAVVPQKTE